jgi:hypothetical protein
MPSVQIRKLSSIAGTEKNPKRNKSPDSLCSALRERSPKNIDPFLASSRLASEAESGPILQSSAVPGSSTSTPPEIPAEYAAPPPEIIHILRSHSLRRLETLRSIDADRSTKTGAGMKVRAGVPSSSSTRSAQGSKKRQRRGVTDIVDTVPVPATCTHGSNGTGSGPSGSPTIRLSDSAVVAVAILVDELARDIVKRES